MSIDSQLFKGQVLGVCMEKPLYKVVLGYVTGVLSDLHDIAKPAQRTRPSHTDHEHVAHKEEPKIQLIRIENGKWKCRQLHEKKERSEVNCFCHGLTP